MSEPGEIETELGVAIPGVILPPEAWAKTALKKLPAEGPLDFAALFGRDAPLVLDLGCGNGRFILAGALRHPEWNYLGLDILPVVIRYATRRANQRGLHNVRLAVSGGHEFLDRFVPPRSVREIHVYHPQPYGDEQKKERRLLTPAFLALAHRCLEPTGRLFLQTDNPAYWQYVTSVIGQFFAFEEQREPWAEDPQGRTRREIMARQMGLPIFRGVGQPRPELDEAALATLVAQLPPPTFDATEHKRKRPSRRRFDRRRKGRA